MLFLTSNRLSLYNKLNRYESYMEQPGDRREQRHRGG